MKYDGFGTPVFRGLGNWSYVFDDYPLFWPALRNTLWLVLVMVTCRVVFGLGVGLLITKIKTGAGVFRTLFYLPYLAPPVAATLAFVFLLNPGTGPVNSSSTGWACRRPAGSPTPPGPSRRSPRSRCGASAT